MTDDAPPNTRKELQQALDRLICDAHENGVEAGDYAYTLRHADADTPDWEVLITKVADQ